MVSPGESHSAKPWEPSVPDIYRAEQGYFRYVTGVAVLNDPDRLFDLYQRDHQDPEQANEILVHAQTLIWDGLGDVVRYANPPHLRKPLSEAEHHYKEAFANMQAVVDETAEKEKARLDRLNPFFAVIRPLPVAYEAIYKSIAHSRRRKVRLAQMMDTFTIDEAFGPNARQLTFEATVHRDTRPEKADGDPSEAEIRLQEG